MLKEYKLTEINQKCLKVWGRGSGRLDPLPVFWTGGGIELNVKAAELWVEVETGSALYETWAAVLLDGDLISRQMLPGGRGWVCLFRGMNPNTVKNLRLLRETQAMPHDPETRLFIHSIKTDGSLEPVAERPYKIEFVGDSITTGEGLGTHDRVGGIRVSPTGERGRECRVPGGLSKRLGGHQRLG